MGLLKIKRFHEFLGTLKSLYFNVRKEDFAKCGKSVILEQPCKIPHPEDISIGNNVGIRSFLTVISRGGKLIIQDNVDISNHLTVVTNAHTITPPSHMWQVDCNHQHIGDKESDVIIESDVWIGINVTILSGVTIGRGAVIGAGSVVTKSIPPYSIAVGNPCKKIRSKFTVEQIIERERYLYRENLRYAREELDRIVNLKND